LNDIHIYEYSHPLLQPIADYFYAESDDFEAHEALFVQVGRTSRTLQSAVVHRTLRGAGAGGVRNWFYDTVEAMLRDGLRLSKGMTHKNALAGLWWGGGKGVIARNSGRGLLPTHSAAERQVVYEEYGEFMSVLRGCYVTAEDVGTSVKDMEHVFSKTRHTTCIPPAFGGSGNPSVPTARGVATALEAAFDHMGLPIKGSSIAVQGGMYAYLSMNSVDWLYTVGHVGSPLIHFLFDLGVGRIIASDVDTHRVESIMKEFAKYGDAFQFRLSDKSDMSILFEDVDAVSPCATGGILNSTTIPKIKAKIVCGAANNQLLGELMSLSCFHFI
jgi:glutamate dehydrogenase/leucine dehydrogenase